MVYHFTSLDNFESIFKSIAKTNGKYLTFWASRIYEVNDLWEMNFGVPIVMDAINDFERWNKIEEQYKLSTYRHYVEMVENTDSLDDATFIKHIVNYQKPPFILSFCRINEAIIKNELPLWTAYGNSGKGICMGFDEDLFKFIDDGSFNYFASDVIYLKDNMEKRLSYEKTIAQMRTHFQNEYNNYWEKMHVFSNESDIICEKRETIASMSSFIGAFVKVADYEYENEYRIAVSPQTSIALQEHINYRLSSSKNLIPYIRVSIPVESLKQITVGSCVSDVTLRNLCMQMQTSGIEIKPTKTDIKFRNL